MHKEKYLSFSNHQSDFRMTLKNGFAVHIIFKTYFHKKCFARSLGLKVRVFGMCKQLILISSFSSFFALLLFYSSVLIRWGNKREGDHIKKVQREGGAANPQGKRGIVDDRTFFSLCKRGPLAGDFRGYRKNHLRGRLYSHCIFFLFVSLSVCCMVLTKHDVSNTRKHTHLCGSLQFIEI